MSFNNKPRFLYALATQLNQPDYTPIASYPKVDQPQLTSAAHKVISSSYRGVDMMRTAAASEIHFMLQIKDDIAVVIAANGKTQNTRMGYKVLDAIFLRYKREGSPKKESIMRQILKDELAKGNAPENDKIYQAEKRIEEVKQVALDNIDKVLQRGEDMEVLDNRVDLLKNDAITFSRKANKLKKKTLITLILLLVAFIAIVLIILAILILALFILICFIIPLSLGKGICFKENNPSSNNTTSLDWGQLLN